MTRQEVTRRARTRGRPLNTQKLALPAHAKEAKLARHIKNWAQFAALDGKLEPATMSLERCVGLQRDIHKSIDFLEVIEKQNDMYVYLCS